MAIRSSSSAEAFTFRAFESLVRQLEASGLMLDDFIDRGNFVFIILDMDLRIMKVNRQAAVLLGLVRDEAIGVSLAELIDKAPHLETFQKTLAKMSRAEGARLSALNFENEFRKGTETLHYNFEAQCLNEDSLAKDCLLVVGTDVTPVKRFIEEKALREQAELQQTIMDTKMKMTANIQKMLLPRFELYNRNSEKIRVIYRPSEDCSGDFWYYREQPDRRIFILCDVQGHGVASGMLGSFINGFIQAHFIGTDAVNERFICGLSDKIMELTGREYLTTFSALEIAQDSILFWNAGGVFPVVVDHQGESRQLAMRSNLMGFGKMAISRIELRRQEVQRVIWHTDGYGDFRKGDERYRPKLIRATIGRVAKMAIGDAENAVKDELKQIAESYTMDDDVTFAIIDI